MLVPEQPFCPEDNTYKAIALKSNSLFYFTFLNFVAEEVYTAY